MKTFILYHGKCPDGFGGAYAAWKKFGDAAEYVPLARDEEPSVEVYEGAELYFVDFVYDQEIMDRFSAVASRVVTLDHHEGAQGVTESFAEHVFDSERSGAGIAWDYFHPGVARPKLIDYIESGDLYRFELPNSRSILAYVYSRPQEFSEWEELHAALEDPERTAAIVAKGADYREHFEILVASVAKRAKLVSFEGHTCYLAFADGMFASDVGNMLATKLPPFALIARAQKDGLRVSMRRAKGNDSVDLAKIAQKYGSNGHPFAAAFSVPWGAPIPWTYLDNEDPRD